MPRYFFNVTDGHGVIPDPEGIGLPDLQAARDYALKDVRDMLGASDRRGLCRRHWRMDVSSEDGESGFSLAFAHALHSDRIALT